MREELVKKIIEELSAERVLTKQVLDHLVSHHEVNLENLGEYFRRVRETTTVEIDDIEDYEIDLAFSPLFTPRLRDRAKYSKLLDHGDVRPDEMEGFIDTIMQAKCEAKFRCHDTVFAMPLHEVLIRRYVRLLNLTTQLSPRMKKAVEQYVPEPEQDTAKALAKDSVWLAEHRQDFLISFLKVFKEKNNFTMDKMDFLTDFVRTYRPMSILNMDSMLHNLIEACHEDIHKIEGGHYLYYHDLVERHYMGSDNEQSLSEKLLHSKERTIIMATELKEDFAFLCETQREYMASVKESLLGEIAT